MDGIANKTARSLPRILLLALFSYLGTTLILADMANPPPSLWCLTAGCTSILAGYLLSPFDTIRENIRPFAAWQGLIALNAYGLFQIHPGLPVTDWNTISLVLGVFMVSCLLGSMHVACDLIIKNSHITLCLVTTTAVFLSLAPIWLAPIADLFGHSQVLVNTIINISPLSYLASMADYDYLRSTWFYQHTPYGGLRYAYLTMMQGSFIYLMFCTVPILVIRRHARDASGDPAQPINSYNKQVKCQGAF